MPPPIDPENVDNTSVPPAITNQVLTSWLLATSPRACAASRRICVGSSVLSSLSAAIAALLFQRCQLVHDVGAVVGVGAQHRGADYGGDEGAHHYRERHADAMDL